VNIFETDPQRTAELPPGCKDLIDLDDIRNWTSFANESWPPRPTDQLAYIEGFLAQLLQACGPAALVCISAHPDRGHVMVRPDPDPAGPALYPESSGSGQQTAVPAAFEELGIEPITKPTGRWRKKCPRFYPLPSDPSVAARFIGQVFRTAYGLHDLAPISFLYSRTALGSKEKRAD
jgi:hypothetical protein